MGGCLSSAGGGGGGGSAGALADYEAARTATENMAPTGNMPTAIDASYTGQVKVAANTGDTAAFFGTNIDPENVDLLGDLNLAINWTDGSGGTPITGTASNIVAIARDTGATTAVGGSLTVDTSQTNLVTRIPLGVANAASGAFNFTMAGELTNGSDSGHAYLGMNGQFFGSGGQAMVGSVSGGINDAATPSPVIFDAGVVGTFYAQQ